MKRKVQHLVPIRACHALRDRMNWNGRRIDRGAQTGLFTEMIEIRRQAIANIDRRAGSMILEQPFANGESRFRK